MSTADLYLIAHKVRGEPAFDIACQIECPVCTADPHEVDFEVPTQSECTHCDGQGYIWMVPTSGHTAYPWWSIDLDLLGEEYNHAIRPGEMPDNWPDHYTMRSAPSLAAPSGLAALLAKRKPLNVNRRGR